MLDQQTWQFVNTFAPWLAAFGTLMAVIISLYLARRADRIAIDVRVGIRLIVVRGGGPGQRNELLWVNITKLALRSSSLYTLDWRPFTWSNAGFIWLATENR